MLDHDLSFNHQIEGLCKKLAKLIGFLHHISPYLKCSQQDIYYPMIIKPVIFYGSMIWTSRSKENYFKVLHLQKTCS